MLIQKIQGWLWNQMFQYAFAKAASLRNNVEFKLDISEYKTYFRPYELEIFDIERNYAKINEVPFYERYSFKNRYFSYINNVIIKAIFKKLNKAHFVDDNLKYHNKFLYDNKGYFEWYFQCEKYFKDYESEIRKDFSFKKTLSKKSNDFINSLQWKETVSVHVRRGDYLKLSNLYNICWKDYYEKGIKYIKDKIKRPTFVFFSDDSEWVRENFNGENYFYVDWNKWKDSWHDMALMSKCKHNIIANSSFSWRGAWLNDNPKKIVISPKDWWKICNKDIVPDNWITF